MDESKKIRLGISVGDLNGIGCEVALKTFEDARMLDFCTPVLFASNKTIAHQKETLQYTPQDDHDSSQQEIWTTVPRPPA